MFKTWNDLESYTQYVYSTLLNPRDNGVDVSRNIKLKGLKGEYQIDVFYQFEHAGVLHRVAIECKYHNRPLDRDTIMPFCNKITDIGNIIGVIVSKSGYQRGAKEYAEKHGITLLTTEDLPKFNILVADYLINSALPTKDWIGEPFWILMEREEDNVSGSYYKFAQKHNGRDVIPLFFSKREAIDFLNEYEQATIFAIRGVPQHYLKRFIGMTERLNPLFFLMLPALTEEQAKGFLIESDELKKKYLLSEISPEEYKEFHVERKSRYENELTLFKILKTMKGKIGAGNFKKKTIGNKKF
ncbi:restriction endonuclease [Citrobacter koseri]|uniref:restriction endonuclease n=1 Tax=Citrobacter koseri TaxID=545 RepID=UPI0028BE210A|nr:restriction endonuclease [Citrobacter koseri]MDT7452512.1 restriction endonuclease [Citrobacter koseri]HEM6829127.1 restriction endonuclease [Citrobacter koseri]HEM6830393.1 restriction endonuclease [Citrobacter koseri]HEM6878757.1 restriction endonuclease [Citrobacter koseri]HEM6880606.1 restriction endonuclease [Citrobacter koseri]